MVKKTDNIKEMFQNIRKNIGKEVICTYYYYGDIITGIFLLTGFKEYEYILVKEGPDYIMFTDFNEYIISILDNEENTLYENILFEQKNYNVKDLRGLINKQKLLFGVDYISTEEQYSKKYLIKQGLNELEPKDYLNWIDFVNINYVLYNYKEIKAVISYINKINNGMSFYEAEIKVFADEFPNIYNKNIALDFISNIYANNSEYLNYIRSDFCTGGQYRPGTKKKKRDLIRK